MRYSPLGRLLYKWQAVVLLLTGMTTANVRGAITVTPEEMAQKTQWVQQNLLTATNLPPFSFSYGTQPSSRVLPSWTRTQTDTVLDSNRTQHVIVWTNTLVQLRCVAVEYQDYPMVEWTVYLKDIGNSTTPLLTNIQALDITLVRTNGSEFVLNGNKGDSTTADSYEPFQNTLGPQTTANFSPPSYSGKSSDGPTGWPYYNLQTSGGGLILAIGWPGQWASSFTRDAANGLRIQAGQQLTHLILNPGEEIRTPLIGMLFWQGTNLVRSQNIWRRWYMAHEIPRVDGQPPTPLEPVGGDSVAVVNSYIQAGIQPDILWQDAGWYPDSQGPYTGDLAWLNTGTWEPDPSRYPNGFTDMSAQINALGVKFMLWFEPERVGNTTSSFLATNDPSWLLPATSTTVGAILNEGNPGAFNWLTNHISGLIRSNDIGWYREDMNGNGPLPAWQNNDSVNRQGITENFYVQGHLAYWDALVAMNHGLRIDSCASGGRRNDLETMRRAVPLTRSDYSTGDMSTVVDGNQCQTYGLSSWLPFQGQGSYYLDPYSFRSFYLASFIIPFGLSPDNTAAFKQAYAECKKVAPILLNGDYYPLTPYSLANNVWMAWQFDRPETGEGCAQIFRRTNSPDAAMTFKLQGLQPGKLYDVQDFDRGELGQFTGNALMSTGLVVQLNPRQSAILYYTNAPGMQLSAGASPTAGSQPLGVQFTANGISVAGLPVAYTWAFDDGGTSTNQNPFHTFAAPGRYVAQVTASDTGGNSDTKQVPITVLNADGHMMTITFNGYDRSEPLTNFPALCVFGTNLSASGFSYSQMASSNGWDLLFLNSNQTQTLNYEIEKWDANGNSYVWVQIPRLLPGTSIRAYWGDTNLASSPSPTLTNGSVWTQGYAGVWHLAQRAGVSGLDATAHRNDGVMHNITAFNGAIGDAAWFDGADAYMDLGTSLVPLANQQSTMSAWVYPLGGTVLIMKGTDASAGSYGLEWSGNSSLAFTFGSTTDWLGDGGSVPPGQWSYVDMIIDGGTKSTYVNGIFKAARAFSGTLGSANQQSLWVGAQNRSSFNYWFNGGLDEVRLSPLARSSNWVWAEYNNMASNQTFNTYGAVTSLVSPNPGAPLAIGESNGNLLLSWPTNLTPAGTMQVSSDLINWTNLTGTVTVNGTNYTMTVPASLGPEFFRLHY
jgi:alpha-galactosidase